MLLASIHQLVLWAEEGQGGGQALMFPLMMLGIFVLFWLIVIRPSMRRQEAERQALFTGLEKNDRVLTAGGIYGIVVAISDKEDEMTIKVEDNVRLKMTRSSVVKNLTKEEKAREAAEKSKEAAK